jgi:nanoRNase/pAp phosphatase (c-di-AMP/oligoRNAs hydrolase)
VRQVAGVFGGGGHKNAAGFTATGSLDEARPRIIALLVEAIARGLQSRPL